ncbi:unnamed protein product [Rangifer tarandus platyrhynchus]|uniref:Uncharacterized protein n=1 Tax=Rangifer tarandus platyrhynchus TaxID=3082113 RepID=A0ABN8Y9I1_RANTA|nr:unnamed protein product [Rangifer tarandus platyrhynchus]
MEAGGTARPAAVRAHGAGRGGLLSREGAGPVVRVPGSGAVRRWGARSGGFLPGARVAARRPRAQKERALPSRGAAGALVRGAWGGAGTSRRLSSGAGGQGKGPRRTVDSRGSGSLFEALREDGHDRCTVEGGRLRKARLGDSRQGMLGRVLMGRERFTACLPCSAASPAPHDPALRAADTERPIPSIAAPPRPAVRGALVMSRWGWIAAEEEVTEDEENSCLGVRRRPSTGEVDSGVGE